MGYKKLILTAFSCVFMIAVYIFYSSYKDSLKWENYFKRTNIGSPNELVLKFFDNEKETQNFIILDLGAGNGSDSIYLLKKGFEVFSVDFFEEAIHRIKANTPKEHSQNIKVIKSSFQDLDWGTLPKFDCIIAINSISFIPRKDFDMVWKKMTSQLKDNGVMIVRLFGNKLNWQNINNMALLHRNEVNQLIKSFDVIHYQEEEEVKNSNIEHAYNLIMKKKNIPDLISDKKNKTLGAQDCGWHVYHYQNDTRGLVDFLKKYEVA